MRIGVLALQGDFAAHRRILQDLGVDSIEVRTPADLSQVDGLILPGGESTTVLKQLLEDGLADPLRKFGKSKPLLGTCAGTILMAREVTSPAQDSFAFMDIHVERNAYGRQADSSIRRLDPEEAFVERTEPGVVEAMFIRAPIVRDNGEGVTTLIADGETPVLVEQGLHLACTFHPELTSDHRIHRLFVEKVRKASE